VIAAPLIIVDRGRIPVQGLTERQLSDAGAARITK
jgi:hypothetical protein